MGDTLMEAGMLPGRKRPCLWLVENGNTIKPLAYFVDRAALERFLSMNVRYTITKDGRDGAA